MAIRVLVERSSSKWSIRRATWRGSRWTPRCRPKNFTFPTDAKLLETAIHQLGRLAKKHEVPLRQSYARVAKRAAMMAGRYAHAKQFKRMNRRVKFLRPDWGASSGTSSARSMVMRALQETFAVALGRAAQIRGQKQRQRGWKLYSWPAPETECLGKGKARAPYEFGAKVSLTTTNRRCKGGQSHAPFESPARQPLRRPHPEG